MGKTIKAIPTEYGGIEFRSKLEAQWAKFFDSIGVRWSYEEQGYDLGDGVRYLPDFYLPDSHVFFEVKGVMNDKDEEKIRRLAKQSETVVIVGGGDGELLYAQNTEPYFGGYGGYKGKDEWNPAFLFKCRKCGMYFFTQDMDEASHCPNCDMISEMIYSGNLWDAERNKEYKKMWRGNGFIKITPEKRGSQTGRRHKNRQAAKKNNTTSRATQTHSKRTESKTEADKVIYPGVFYGYTLKKAGIRFEHQDAYEIIQGAGTIDYSINKYRDRIVKENNIVRVMIHGYASGGHCGEIMCKSLPEALRDNPSALLAEITAMVEDEDGDSALVYFPDVLIQKWVGGPPYKISFAFVKDSYGYPVYEAFPDDLTGLAITADDWIEKVSSDILNAPCVALDRGDVRAGYVGNELRRRCNERI